VKPKNESKITKKTTIEELAAIVSHALSKAGIEAILSGGSVVSIYADNEYQTHDLDFVTADKIQAIGEVMAALGFERKRGRHFMHPNTEYFVEFPPAPLAIGDKPVRSWGQRKTKSGTIQLLTPTQCVMDRLAGYYFWKDRQNLEQAAMVAARQPVNLSEIGPWTSEIEVLRS
jgi:hypothetical protein